MLVEIVQIATLYKWKWLPVTDGGLCPRNARGSRSNHDRNSFLHHAPPLHTLLNKQIGKQEAIIKVLFNQMKSQNFFSQRTQISIFPRSLLFPWKGLQGLIDLRIDSCYKLPFSGADFWPCFLYGLIYRSIMRFPLLLPSPHIRQRKIIINNYQASVVQNKSLVYDKNRANLAQNQLL